MFKFKKFVAGALSIVICTISLVTPATTDAATYYIQEDDPFTRLEEKGFRIITSVNTYSLRSTDMSNIDSHLLLDQQVFSDVLSNQSEEIKEAIYDGNIIAVFDNTNKDFEYEKTLGLPLGFDNVRNSRRGTHKSIGYIYQADELGDIHITRVNTRNGADSDEEINTFAEILLNYETREAVSSVMSRSTLSTEFIGSVADYYYGNIGNGKKGDVSVVYEVSTAQDIGGYDYYAVHAYIDAIPGDELYGSKYDADKLRTSIGTTASSPDAILYKTGPNTMTHATTYTVDIGIGGSSDGLEGAGGFSWSREVPDVNIYKNVKSSSKCEWEVNIKDWGEAADHTLSFEPGGTFRVADYTQKLHVVGNTVFSVDAWNEFPSVAASGYTFFYCSEDEAE